MKITFSYFAQIRQKAGVESETIKATDGSTLLEALKTIDHGEGFQSVLFDENGGLHPVIMFVVKDVPAASDLILSDGDCVQVFSPVAGG